ncbi:MAG: glycoside hydrolase family 172 protein [Phycisphaerales bacterium]
MRKIAIAVVAALCACRGWAQVDFAALGREMTDPRAVSRWPEHPYTCRQFSSYDRASVSAAAGDSWFANGDANHFLRVEEVPTEKGVRKEWVMAEATGPGAIVRIWTPNPKGVLRVYLDGAATPLIQTSMEKLLAGSDVVGPPLAQSQSRGWNLFLPIPYATGMKVTIDATGSYYHVNYRTYEKGTLVTTLTAEQLAASKPLTEAWNAKLSEGTPLPVRDSEREFSRLAPGEAATKGATAGPGVVTGLTLAVRAADIGRAMRALVIVAEFDGEQTVWCPVGDFFGTGTSARKVGDWFRASGGDTVFACRWPMPFRSGAKFTLRNVGDEPVECSLDVTQEPAAWDERSMHFHAVWNAEFGIRTKRGAGTVDWNFATVKGKGVVVGDNLSVFNPVAPWWGEGDEKLYVDGEEFPSHFGTGTEDYYGFGWCDPTPFLHPFHSQIQCDGYRASGFSNNRGHTFLTRLRSLDAIPFTTDFRFDMEVWHWQPCTVDYASTLYFYAFPGATTNIPDQPELAKLPPRQLPPPMTIAGAIECESLWPTARSEGTGVDAQDLSGIGDGGWSNDNQLWVKGRAIGDFVELSLPAGGPAPVRVVVHATKSWDYGIVRFFVNGARAGKDTDLFSGGQGRVMPSGPIDLGVHAPKSGVLKLRAEVVGGNLGSAGTRSYFGLDCVVLRPEPQPEP